MAGAKAKLEELAATMRETLASFGDKASPLAALARLAVERNH